MDLHFFKSYILDSQQRPLPSLTGRNHVIPFIPDSSISIVGPRRCGKTYRTFQYIAEMVTQGAHPQDFCRIQFNDLRLTILQPNELALIPQAYYALYPRGDSAKTVYFIFDEIHRIDGWEDFVLALMDDPRHRVVITGSTAKLMRGEYASALRGKNFATQLFPFSFREFVNHLRIPLDTISSNGQSALRHAFDQYLILGGFPAVYSVDERVRIELLQSYWETMLLRDIIESHPEDNINIDTLNFLAAAIISRVGCPVSIRKIQQELTSLGLKFTLETLYRYMRYFDEAFMINTIHYYTQSSAIRNRHPQKPYVVDWALGNAVCPGMGIELTRRFENCIYVELMRQKYSLAYYVTRNGYEIDFIAIEKGTAQKKILPIQVCFRMENEAVKERELRGLPETIQFVGADYGLIVTLDEEGEVIRDGLKIHIVPAWKWLLGE